MAGFEVTNNNVKKQREIARKIPNSEKRKRAEKVSKLIKNISNRSSSGSGSGRKSTSSNESNISVNRNKPRTKLPEGGLTIAFRKLNISRPSSPVELVAMKIDNANTKNRQDLVLRLTTKLTRGLSTLSRSEKSRRSRVKKKLLNAITNKKINTTDLKLMTKMNVNSLVNALEKEFPTNLPVYIPENKGSAIKPKRR
tara:strand:+ start:7027 stop:7617 length:591 start_codon:yes stop_codon:yes gene_type:complete